MPSGKGASPSLKANEPGLTHKIDFKELLHVAVIPGGLLAFTL